MRFVTLTYRNIFRRRMRSVLTISGVAVAVGAVVALVGISRGFERSLLTIYENRGVDLVVVRAGGLSQLTSSLDESLSQKIAALPHVRNAAPMLTEVVSLKDFNLFGVVIQGMPLEGPPITKYKIVAGRRIAPGDSRSIMVGRILAADLGKRVGDSLEVIEGESFRIVGLYDSFNVFENGSMIMSLDELQKLMGREGEVTGFTVVADRNDRATIERLRDEVKSLAPNLDAMRTEEFVDNSVEIRMAQSVAWLTSTIALVVGTIGMINTMLTAVFERTRELALLRAIGWRKRSVMKLILVESLLLSLAGAVVGTTLAMGLTWALSRVPASGRLVAGDISSEVVLQGFAVALFVGLVGGIFPAMRAAALMPTEGLRHE